MPVIDIDTASKKYSILIAGKSITLAGKHARDIVPGRKAFVVTDDNVGGLYLDGVVKSLEKESFSTDSHSIIPGEESKNKHELFVLYDKMNAFGITRSDIIIALGGGVVGDLAGFAAATYLRGVPYMGIPTSLLAQVDSSVGGKTAIDMPFGKNMVGAFYHPADVIIDPDVLDTLPEEVFNDGMAEVIKYGCIKDAGLFEEVCNGGSDLINVIERCVRIKADIVERDEHDKGERMILNFGHTIGHAMEKVCGYKDISHGRAVATGMVVAARLGEKLKVSNTGTEERIKECLRKYNLPVHNTLDADKVLAAIKSDKKNLAERLCFILLEEIGKGTLYYMDRDELTDKLREVLENA